MSAGAMQFFLEALEHGGVAFYHMVVAGIIACWYAIAPARRPEPKRMRKTAVTYRWFANATLLAVIVALLSPIFVSGGTASPEIIRYVLWLKFQMLCEPLSFALGFGAVLAVASCMMNLRAGSSDIRMHFEEPTGQSSRVLRFSDRIASIGWICAVMSVSALMFQIRSLVLPPALIAGACASVAIGMAIIVMIVEKAPSDIDEHGA